MPMPKYEATCNVSAGKDCRLQKGQVAELSEDFAAPLVVNGLLKEVVEAHTERAMVTEQASEAQEFEPKKSKRSKSK